MILQNLCNRSSFDSTSPRGYIDLFLKAQEDKQGNYFTDQDLLIGCQVKNTNFILDISFMVFITTIKIKDSVLCSILPPNSE